MKRASYREGIAWIASNDDAGAKQAHNINQVAAQVTVLMLADLFGQRPQLVAEQVVKYRMKHDIGPKLQRPTKPGFWSDFGADDLFEEGTDDYFEQQCIDYHGSAVRDNTREQRIAIGKDIEENGFEG